MTQLNSERLEKPVKPKKPLPTKKKSAKISVVCCLSEEQIRKIARE